MFLYKQNKLKPKKELFRRMKSIKDSGKENTYSPSIAELQSSEVCTLISLRSQDSASSRESKSNRFRCKRPRLMSKMMLMLQISNIYIHIHINIGTKILNVLLRNQMLKKEKRFAQKEDQGRARREICSILDAKIKKDIENPMNEIEEGPKKDWNDRRKSKMSRKETKDVNSKHKEKESKLEKCEQMLEIVKLNVPGANLKPDSDKSDLIKSAGEDEKLIPLKQSNEKKDTEREHCEENISKCQSDFNFDILHHGFHLRPQQLWSVYMLDTLSIQNLTVIGSIPWAWLREEKWRLHTFAKYPHNTSKSAILLAEAGFAYVGNGRGSDDSVICFFCRGTKQGWREDEDITETHRTLNPNCPMVTGSGSGNIPLIAPTNISFALQNSPLSQVSSTQANNRDSIETDGCGESNNRSGNPSHAGQQQQVRGGGRKSAQATPGVQMATRTIMSPPPPRQVHSQGQIQTDSFQQNQPSDNNATSSLVTSSNTVPPLSSAPAVSDEGSGTQQNSTAPASVQSDPGSAQPRTVSDSSERASGMTNPQPSSASTNTTSSVSQSAGSSTSATQANQPSTPAAQANPSSAPANQSTPAAPVNPPAVPQNPSYHDLGIITERPKRYEYAVRLKRLETFGDWPKDHHLKKEDLSDAGFYFAGYGDCARCFYCGGGLRNWDKDDDVWVEHARWFPKCAFIRQRVGQVFVDTVALLGRDHEKISFEMVVEKMKIDPSAFQIDSKETPLRHDAAVLTVREMGYKEEDILSAALSLRENGQILSADLLYMTLEEKEAVRQGETLVMDSNSSSSPKDVEKDKELLNTLKQTNNDLRLQTLCKICMDKEVAVVFLPCGHLVCCTECASAMKDCPVCRKQVKGIVRAFMG